MSEGVTLRSNERIAIVGKTGSGKTYLAQRLVFEPFDHVLFYDYKHHHYPEMEWPVLHTASDVDDALARGDPSKFVVAPHDLSLGEWDAVCEAAWDHGNVHVINDEMKGLYAGEHIPTATEYHQRILMQGRVRGVGMTNITQRPRSVPVESISECEHVFCFRLNLHDDRKRMAEVMGEQAAIDAGNLTDHRFLYWNPSMDEARVCDPL